ncbi:glypican-5 [Trichonephila inaurata madagascariensis]|uniref:Glypican-5 n=1 Tax=Trichonephila inaurata madagascariensis TaxID=2747483 RepID=A0A8X6XF88_9ARAC|nr:glypican-5 [Trichonephila inaurata madagascariensis]
MRMIILSSFKKSEIASEVFCSCKPLKGKDLNLCPSSQTCCSKSMESKFEEAGRKDLKNLLQGADSYLKTLISTSATKFGDTFLEMVQVAENSTNALFLDVYQSIEAQSRVPLGQLFADLLAYMSGKDVDLEERASSFFDSLFPIAYHHSVNSNQKDFSESFKECLRDAQVEIRPFGELSEKIASQISRSFEAARTFLEALQLGLEVINTTEHMDFGPECSEAFVRLAYCPQCQGFLQAKPCAGLCLNVVRGCLASVSELDDSWSEYVSALERLTSGMVGIYNIEHVLSTLDTKISETVSYLMANSAEVSKRVKDKCGTPRRVSRELSPATPGSSMPFAMRPVSDTSLYMMLQNFVQKVAESKDFYANLADRLCSDGQLVTKGDLNCWNGSGLAEYTKTVAGIGVSAQKYNPEMKSPRVRDVTVSTLADKLQHVKQILNARVTSVPQSDSSVVGEGSGSGAWWKTSDDEDYAQASGSGDTSGDKTDLHFERTDGDVKDKSGSMTSQMSLVLVIFCTSLVLKMK